ncbi:ThuA domain-containing protein [bacterium]|nr:ThuA domain-containing protein [bacterium]
MIPLRRLLITLAAVSFLLGATDSEAAEKKSGNRKKKQPASPKVGPKVPIRALLITGGCCHNYFIQSKLLTEGVSRNVNVDWTVLHDGGKGTQATIKLYNDPDWARPYDVVIHNECFANTADPDYIRSITKAHHAGVNAVVIHCAMHTYRAAEIDDWREFLGVTSRRHEHQSHYGVSVSDKDNWITQAIPDGYKTPMDELYVIEKTWPNTTVLATSVSEKTQETHPVVWTNTYGEARVFGTTYGHSVDTFSDETFLELIVRGLVWAAECEPQTP